MDQMEVIWNLPSFFNEEEGKFVSTPVTLDEIKVVRLSFQN